MSIDIRDIGIVLCATKHSESSLIIKILSKEHGIYSGFVRGGASSKKSNSTYQIANLVDFTWKAKVSENLGFLKIEPIKSFLAKIIFDNLKLSCVTAIFNVIQSNIMDREPHQQLFMDLLQFLTDIDSSKDKFLMDYVRLELNLLQTLGYGVDLSSCALTGKLDDLCYVSPRTGRAACREAGIKYQDKLLKLPSFLVNNEVMASNEDIMAGLDLSSFFLKKHLIQGSGKFFELRSKATQLAKA